jgi:hypothetical protein
MKKAINMTPEERKTALDEIIKAARTPEPMPPTEKKAANMSAQERAEWLAEHKRRQGL